MKAYNFNIKGLTSEEVEASGKASGFNLPDYKETNGLPEALKSLVKEPMVILLLAASIIYFITGNVGDGIFLAAAIILISVISLYQDSRSRNALEKLKSFTQPICKVIRNGETMQIKSEEIVVGDFLMIEEGSFVAADGTIIHSNDFSVNESILTGESLVVSKDITKDDKFVYQGTTVASGLAVIIVTAIASETKLGRIGKSLESIKEEKTPLKYRSAIS